MNTPLPDDMSLWPADPFELLGVTRGAAEDDIRRAYTRLIRRFKPEHHPAEFQRIRDAYDACRSQSYWYRTEPEAEKLPAIDAPPLPVSRAEELWQRAVDGRLEEAYDGLRIELRADDHPQTPLRLYWLLTLNPALEPARSRHEWLAEALRRSRLDGHAVELYRRELDLDPNEALGGPYAELLETPAEFRHLAAVVRLRLTAATRNDRKVFMRRELETLNRRRTVDSELDWLSLVCGVAEWACWERFSTLSEYCNEQLLGLRHLELQQSWHFDRLDTSYALANDCRRAVAHSFPHSVLEFLRAGVTVMGRIMPEDYRKNAESLANLTYERLEYFGGSTNIQGFNLVAMVANVLEDGRHRSETDYPESHLRAQVRLFHVGFGPGNHRALLDWLHRDGIHPYELASALDADPDAFYRQQAGRLREDHVLRLLWIARQICDS